MDINQIATRRQRLIPNQRPMAYLLDRINNELLERIQQSSSNNSTWLQIDYQNSPLNLPASSTKRSLVEGELLDNIPDASIDNALLNIQLAWLDPKLIFTDLRRLLKPGAKLFFCTLGPDTLFELNEAFATFDTTPHTHPFIDLHHLGDQLIKLGYQKPILDADWVGVEYDDIDLLMNDLRTEGFHNLNPERRKTLTGKNKFEQLRQYFSNTNPRITFELIYGYAEMPTEKSNGIRVNVPA